MTKLQRRNKTARIVAVKKGLQSVFGYRVWEYRPTNDHCGRRTQWTRFGGNPAGWPCGLDLRTPGLVVWANQYRKHVLDNGGYWS